MMADLNARTKINIVNMITQNALPSYSAGIHQLITTSWSPTYSIFAVKSQLRFR
jgi:hypothetical protein